MTQEHPITPPPELVQKIADGPGTWLEKISKAYCAGADQELEACCEILRGEFNYHHLAEPLHSARRPKPPSLKEQAINTLHMIRDHLPADMYDKTFLIRRALEALPS